MTKTKSVVTTHNVFGTLLNVHMSQFSSSVKMMELNYTSDEVPASLEISMWLWDPGGNVYINQYISENINRTCNTPTIMLSCRWQCFLHARDKDLILKFTSRQTAVECRKIFLNNPHILKVKLNPFWKLALRRTNHLDISGHAYVKKSLPNF